MSIRECPRFTTVHDALTGFCPRPGSVYVHEYGVEERATHVEAWRQNADGVNFITVLHDEANVADLFHADIEASGVKQTLTLRSAASLKELWNRYGTAEVYLDITALRHHVWARMLASLLDDDRQVHAVYVEPMRYQPSLTPTEGEVYDLSERTLGVQPLPGFASLSQSEEPYAFIPLLGFEGARAANIAEHVQPPAEWTYPIVGVPGFRMNYPFEAYLGNRQFLGGTDLWHRIRFAEANCPFAAIDAIKTLAEETRVSRVKLSPIGTKPHAIGAVLYAILDPSSREIVYDHPIRKDKRTIGASRLFVYHVSLYLNGQ